tara:strand:+ start:141 stop:284 length:144 start_codon:yes stop_codon:yes gene_type:complete
MALVPVLWVDNIPLGPPSKGEERQETGLFCGYVGLLFSLDCKSGFFS